MKGEVHRANDWWVTVKWQAGPQQVEHCWQPKHFIPTENNTETMKQIKYEHPGSLTGLTYTNGKLDY